ncbi:hypothetical protein MUP65_01540, partial [Patescibacteria group bacterium]|nr:hypothetical protein [Patescibacteria group bacterium]
NVKLGEWLPLNGGGSIERVHRRVVGAVRGHFKQAGLDSVWSEGQRQVLEGSARLNEIRAFQDEVGNYYRCLNEGGRKKSKERA